MEFKLFFLFLQILSGCGINNIALEFILKLDSKCGIFLTFFELSSIAIVNLPRIISKYLQGKGAKIPFKSFLPLVGTFFLLSITNNIAYAFSIPVPLHMIFRSASLITNALLRFLILNEKINLKQLFALIFVSFGTFTASFSSYRLSKQQNINNNNIIIESEQKPGNFLIGVFFLFVVLFMSAFLGVLQEITYKKYGRYPEEVLYFSHSLSVPLFIPFYKNIYSHIKIFNKSKPFIFSDEMISIIPSFISQIPRLWIFFFINILTYHFCIRGVYQISSITDSLTTTFMLSVRKFISILISVLYFRNVFTFYHWISTILVFSGSIFYVIGKMENNQKKEIKKSN
ncbi:udp-xylose and udp-n-acetylglucosamine transporter [Anaeramoeba ignava]|uniref:Udp-xylose and udp-n-acetylglucosamine transporter n=1 Tax=Anaeramoeba ignava TaxID=1746090 RepID=A0A9Q0LG81_ANAIG|nr:udp-xylose and udp-n-acetylglucosamine transporter [Anaeramoeba ignava]